LEIGVAKGGSTVALAQAVKTIGGHLTGIDPCQLEEHGSAAMKLLEKYALLDAFTLIPRPTHLAAPSLIETGTRFDFVFIDGMHSFEYKMLDAFYGDRLLRDGGLLVFHDLVFQSTKKVFRLLETTGRFRPIRTPSLRVTWLRRGRNSVVATLKGRAYPLW
jgi:predicted O-methyltransferase YrrM